MEKDIGYFISIRDGEHGDTEAFIRRALEHEMISNWAYILHDNDTYNQHDMDARPSGLAYAWANGFAGMEKYSSKEAYIAAMMKEPPFIGDKRDAYWRIVCFVDKKCYDADIEKIFEITHSPLPDFLRDRQQITDRLKYLMREDDWSLRLERNKYPAEAVKANFDFQEYIKNTPPRKEKTKWEKFLDVMRPAPLKPRRRSW